MARNIIRERFLAEKDIVIETAMGKAESWAKKVHSGQSGVMLDDIPKLLMALGLKVVPASRICVDMDQYNALVALAKIAMDQMKKIETPADQLDWE